MRSVDAARDDGAGGSDSDLAVSDAAERAIAEAAAALATARQQLLPSRSSSAEGDPQRHRGTSSRPGRAGGGTASTRSGREEEQGGQGQHEQHQEFWPRGQQEEGYDEREGKRDDPQPGWRRRRQEGEAALADESAAAMGAEEWDEQERQEGQEEQGQEEQEEQEEGVEGDDVPLALPGGWELARSRSTGRLYYFEPATSRSVYDPPPGTVLCAPPPPGCVCWG